jgi:AhpD family alkylhydroperoxidase
MIKRLNYMETNARAVNGFGALSKHLSSINEKLRALIELRVSQINGCVYCIDLHTRQARTQGEKQQRLDCIAGWREYPFFDQHEKAALAWAEVLTNISDSHAIDTEYDQLKACFND